MAGPRADGFRRLGGAFAEGAERYDRLRPGYPEEAVAWLVEGVPEGSVAVDVGAGTGKLTAALLAGGLQVIAVDPSHDMLRQLSQHLPAVSTRLGTGEATGLRDDTADLVTFAQSWHWVDPDGGATETLRILKPGGRAGWLWNLLDVRVPWVADLADIWHTVAGDEAVDATRQHPELPPPFGPMDVLTIDWALPVPIIDLAELVTTRSYYLAASATEQRRITAHVETFLAAQFPDADVIDLPYQTHCFRADSLPPRGHTVRLELGPPSGSDEPTYTQGA